MIPFFDPTGTRDGLQRLLKLSGENPAISGLLILCADGNSFTPDTIDPLLKAETRPLIGGIFPSIIADGCYHRKGTLLIGLTGPVEVQIIPGLNDDKVDFESSLDAQPNTLQDIGTLILFVDGFAARTSNFIESLFNVYGLDFNYVGGGAASTWLDENPCLLSNKGMVDDAAVLAFMQNPSGVGVCHGWEELAGPFQATTVNHNTILTIEWQPALDFYQKILADKVGIELDPQDFYATAQLYPFGISRLDGEQIVRDPIHADENGGLVLSAEIQEGTFLSILTGSNDNLISAAAESLQRANEAFAGNAKPSFGFFVDCISRAILLGEEFHRELEAVQTSGLKVYGICSVGEIANSGIDYLELYNKTSVMAVFG